MKRVEYPNYKWTFRPFSNSLHFFEEFFRIFPIKDYYLINALPKSGSTYLYNLMTKLTKVKKIDLKNYRYRATEQDLYIPALLDARLRTTLTRHHFKATDQNVDLLRIFCIKPIILVRNMFDLVSSYRDNLIKGLKETGICPWGYSNAGYVNESYLNLDKKRQYDYVIDISLPWFFSFYTSWYCVNKAGFDVLWLKYEELTDSPKDALNKICKFYHLKYPESEIMDAITLCRGEDKLNNYNIGIKGRGKSELSEEQKDRIKRFTQYYPTVEFNKVGL